MLPFTFPLANVDALARDERDWDYANGLVMNTEGTAAPVLHAPHMMVPSPFPHRCYEQGMELAVPFNNLYAAVANDTAFLQEHLLHAAESDEFTRKLLLIMRDVPSHQIQPIQCAILRSDYMLNQPASSVKMEAQIKQVEINTISAGFGTLSNRVSRLHRHVVGKLSGSAFHNVPISHSDTGIVGSMFIAWKLYGNANAVVIFVVQPLERNKFDQLHLQYLLAEKDVTVVRHTFEELQQLARVDDHGKLFVGDHEVAMLYFRAGYAPSDYKSEKDWDLRRLLESSKAIKIPTVPWQLAGAKKIQQVLADDAHLSRFVPDAAVRRLIHSSFIGLYALDDASISRALRDPHMFVLKPQREGGGNNLYDDQLVHKLRDLPHGERAAWILMEKIVGRPFHSCVMRNGATSEGQFISELGVFSGFVRDAHSVHSNHALGFLLRTKGADQNETGVAAGFGALDSPYLTK